MPTWNECYARIHELYKENLNLRESVGRLDNKIIQAQNMIDELEMLRVAQNTTIKALNEALDDRKEFSDKQQEMIDRLELKRVSNLKIIKEQEDHITALTTAVENLKEEVDSLTDFINYVM
jgi:uncharacterized coiled-coil protein SlyX